MSQPNALPLVLLTEQFAKLPGIGMKSAQRLAYHVMSMSEKDAKDFADAISSVHSKVHLCKRCQNFTEKDICSVCADGKRDHSLVCVDLMVCTMFSTGLCRLWKTSVLRI